MGNGPQEKIAVLISGGMDSAVLLGWALATTASASVRQRRSGASPARFREVFPVYVRAGMKWEKAELFWLRRFLARVQNKALRPLHILENPVKDLYPDHWSVQTRKHVPGIRSRDAAVFLPGRNLLLLSKVSVFCFLNKLGNIGLGTLKGNPFLDGRPEFFRAFETAMRRGTGRAVRIHAPFRRKSKTQVASLGKDLPLELTFSCLDPQGVQHCGRCNKCAERAKAWKYS